MKPALKILCTMIVVVLLSAAAETSSIHQAEDYNALIGTWDIEIIEMGFQMELVFKMEEEELAGEMIFEMGSGVMEKIEFEDGELTFYVEFDANGQVMGVDVSGTVEEDKINGFMASDMGTVEFTGAKRIEE